MLRWPPRRNGYTERFFSLFLSPTGPDTPFALVQPHHLSATSHLVLFLFFFFFSYDFQMERRGKERERDFFCVIEETDCGGRGGGATCVHDCMGISQVHGFLRGREEVTNGGWIPRPLGRNGDIKTQYPTGGREKLVAGRGVAASKVMTLLECTCMGIRYPRDIYTLFVYTLYEKLRSKRGKRDEYHCKVPRVKDRNARRSKIQSTLRVTHTHTHIQRHRYVSRG